MHAELFVAIGIIVRDELTCDRLRALMYELARIGLFEVSQPVPVSGIGSRLRFFFRPRRLDALHAGEAVLGCPVGLKFVLNGSEKLGPARCTTPGTGDKKKHAFLRHV